MIDRAHLHAHSCPLLLRSATVRTFMIGIGLVGTAQRDPAPEGTTARLRERSEEHYGG